jgi:hypothetical protein
LATRIADEIEVAPVWICRGDRSMRSAKAAASAAVAIRVHGSTLCCRSVLAHSIRVTAIAPYWPLPIAATRSGSRKA